MVRQTSEEEKRKRHALFSVSGPAVARYLQEPTLGACAQNTSHDVMTAMGF